MSKFKFNFEASYDNVPFTCHSKVTPSEFKSAKTISELETEIESLLVDDLDYGDCGEEGLGGNVETYFDYPQDFVKDWEDAKNGKSIKKKYKISLTKEFSYATAFGKIRLNPEDFINSEDMQELFEDIECACYESIDMGDCSSDDLDLDLMEIKYNREFVKEWCNLKGIAFDENEFDELCDDEYNEDEDEYEDDEYYDYEYDDGYDDEDEDGYDDEDEDGYEDEDDDEDEDLT